MQPIRLFFPLFKSRQLVLGVNSAYRLEINKLRKFGASYILPQIPKQNLVKYPYKFHIIFYVYEKDDYDAISCLTIANYILTQFENHEGIQSTDYRVIPKMEIEVKKVVSRLGEGCEFCFEKTTVETPSFHF